MCLYYFKNTYLLRTNISAFHFSENTWFQMNHEHVINIMEATRTTSELADEIIARNPPNYAYVTFLAGDTDYVKGVVCLAKGLRKVQAAYPLVVAVLPDVPEEHRDLLLKQGCLLREIDPVIPPVGTKESPFARAYFVINYCKLELWKFVEYRKIIYMDADMQVLRNIDNLFDLPSGRFYAPMDCLCQLYGPCCKEAVKWPKVLGKEPEYYFNGGMFLLEPCLRTYTRLLSTLAVTPPTAFAEQDFLNYFFKGKAKPLHHGYNLLVSMLWRHPEYIEFDQVKVVHFCVAGSKPWRYTGNEEYMARTDVKKFVDGWWDVYNDASLDFPGNGPSHQVSPWYRTI